MARNVFDQLHLSFASTLITQTLYMSIQVAITSQLEKEYQFIGVVIGHNILIIGLSQHNSLYAGLPLNLLQELQLVQNAAAQVHIESPLRTHIQTVLYWLHWL